MDRKFDRKIRTVEILDRGNAVDPSLPLHGILVFRGDDQDPMPPLAILRRKTFDGPFHPADDGLIRIRHHEDPHAPPLSGTKRTRSDMPGDATAGAKPGIRTSMSGASL